MAIFGGSELSCFSLCPIVLLNFSLSFFFLKRELCQTVSKRNEYLYKKIAKSAHLREYSLIFISIFTLRVVHLALFIWLRKKETP